MDRNQTITNVAAILGVTAVICSLIWGIVYYNLQTNKMLFENGYSEVQAPAGMVKTWVKTNSSK